MGLQWKTAAAALVCHVALVYIKAQRPLGMSMHRPGATKTDRGTDAIPPLLISSSHSGVQALVLWRLEEALGLLPAQPNTVAFRQLSLHAAQQIQGILSKMLLREPLELLRPINAAPIDIVKLAEDLHLDDDQGKAALAATIKRLYGKHTAMEESQERGVTEL